MQKWAYCQLTWFVQRTTADRWAEMQASGEADGLRVEEEGGELLEIGGQVKYFGHPSAPILTDDFGEAIATLGMAGWEMIGVVNDMSVSPCLRYYFKMPVDL